jgi:uncharacterized protein involved in type VI secretion and phage assembly
VLLRVRSVGLNNLPSPAQQALAELFGPLPELLEETVADASDDFALTIAQARETGYANSFEAVAADVIWRPQLPGSDGRSHPKPTARGAQSAIVIGADGRHSRRVRTNCIATSWAACASATTGRTMATPPAGCAWRSARPAAAWAASSCRASARKCWCSLSRTISTGPSSSARCTTGRARAASRRRPLASSGGAATVQSGR